MEYPQIISILFLVRHSKPMQALPSIFMSMTLYVTGKNSMTLCVTASMTLCVTAKFCMTLCVTSSISLKIGCMTQKCMTQKYRPTINFFWVLNKLYMAKREAILMCCHQCISPDARSLCFINGITFMGFCLKAAFAGSSALTSTKGLRSCMMQSPS